MTSVNVIKFHKFKLFIILLQSKKNPNNKSATITALETWSLTMDKLLTSANLVTTLQYNHGFC